LAIDPFVLDFPARLAGVDLRRLALYRFDVLVVGGGVAGASAAIAAAEAGAEVALVTKAELEESNTLYAQGGIAAVFGEQDSVESHVQDTLSVGCGLCEPDVVEKVVRGGPPAVARLLAWGAGFDRSRSGALALSREGGHSHPRVLHAGGDATGREVQRTLVASVLAQSKITPFPNLFVVDLLRDDRGGVCGALCARANGERFGITASQVILATGGGGQLYRETTNPVIATADGVALALRVGAPVRDLEFFQFHPTCLYIAGAARVLISEIVRGSGGILRDKHGERFMQRFHPDAELAPRDVVSRAVAQRMAETEDTNVYLDLSRVPGDPHTLFPSISRTCGFFGIDIAKDPIPVRPGLHYMVGGVATDSFGATATPGLWAVGECASSGLHGANRMGSNSLLEGLVLGEICGQAAAASVREVRRADITKVPAPADNPASELRVNLEDVTYALKSLMWREVGVVRQADQLLDALNKIDLWARAVERLGPPQIRTHELLNMLTVARVTVLCALNREESRGVHSRLDFPVTNAEGVHSVVQSQIEGARVRRLILTKPPVSAQVQNAGR
jgi:L-aspartate oxidase